MSFNINNISGVVPIGSIIASCSSSTDQSGWVFADGVARNNNDGKYNALISLGIGTSIGGYTPPNFKGAFLRGIGSIQHSSITYTGVSGFVESKTQSHTHTVTNTAHTHTHNAATDSGTANYGLGVMNGVSTENQGLDSNGTNEINNNYLNGTVLSTETVVTWVGWTQIPNRPLNNYWYDYVGDTSPYCVGVNWLIKY